MKASSHGHGLWNALVMHWTLMSSISDGLASTDGLRLADASPCQRDVLLEEDLSWTCWGSDDGQAQYGF